MALSESIKNSLETAEQEIRNALSFAARSEQPGMSVSLADILQRIDALKKIDYIVSNMEERFENGMDPFGFTK